MTIATVRGPIARVIASTPDVLRHDPVGTWITRYVDASDATLAKRAAIRDVIRAGWVVTEVASVVIQASGLWRVEIGVLDHAKNGKEQDS